MPALRVLVIDDEPDVLLLCRVNFESAGHEVLQAPDGERGLELAVAERPDLILLDVMLPTIDGYEVLRRLSSSSRTSEVPVVLLTAKARAVDRVRGWRAGASEYVTKPFSPPALTELAEQIHAMTPSERVALRERALSTFPDPEPSTD